MFGGSMQYILCPRCQFKAPLNKHICATCGGSLPTAGELISKSQSEVLNEKKPSLWQKVLGGRQINVDTASDSAQEEPVLS